MAADRLEYLRDMANELADMADSEGEEYLGYIFKLAEMAAANLIDQSGVAFGSHKTAFYGDG